jgi:hypothetical protein
MHPISGELEAEYSYRYFVNRLGINTGCKAPVFGPFLDAQLLLEKKNGES